MSGGTPRPPDAWVAQVREALAAIPHDLWCHSCDEQPELQGPCTCDREQRIAERVAAAIEVAWGGFWGDGRGTAEDVLRALGEGTP